MSGFTFEEFDSTELAAWLVRTRGDYISERLAAGDSSAQATASADASFATTFPEGSPSPGQLAGWLSDEGVRVGELWLGPRGDDARHWWVWNVAIDPPYRGRGLGRRAMLLAEELATAHGATSIGLNVFGHNRVARSLYRSLGYEESAIQMRKTLPSPPHP